MIKLLKRIHLIYFLCCVFVTFTLLFPIYFLLSRKPAFYGLLNKCRKFQAGFVICVTGIWVRFKFEEELAKGQTYIFCANHASTLDIIIFCLLAKGRFHFMGKGELLKNPILGIFFKTIDIPVARESKISAFRAFKKAAENLEQGMSLIIFPEGKIGDKYPPVLQAFKNGPFRLAIEKNVPIVPVSITNAWQLLWDDGFKYGSKPGFVDVYVHKPILTSILAVENDEVLKSQVYQKINSKL